MKYIIVGAGISGLTTGYELLKAGVEDFLIIEGRNRVGGRILSKHGVDFGATWFQNYHTHLVSLLYELQLTRHDQYRKGKSLLVYNSMAAAHYFEQNPDEPAAQRISGGTSALIHALAEKLTSKIQLGTTVKALTQNDTQITLSTSAGVLQAEKIALTLPPKLAAELDYSPSLPLDALAAMKDTHTWMSNSIKVGITFKTPFWREKDHSGTVISQISPVTELYDHSNADETEFSLMGFLNERMRDESPENRREQILAYLEKYLGSEIRSYLAYEETDWSKDEFTSTSNITPVYMHPQYGNPLIQQPFWNEKLYFSGTETSAEYGGYMEGAVISGKKAAGNLLG